MVTQDSEKRTLICSTVLAKMLIVLLPGIYISLKISVIKGLGFF